MTDQTQVRTLATQLIRNAIKEIDSEVACGHVVATLGEDVDVDALAFGSEAAVRKAQIDISWDGDSEGDASRLARVEQVVERARDKGNASVDIFVLLDALGMQS